MGLLSLWSCDAPKDKRVVLDNPTRDEITFKIDEQSYTIPAGGRQLIELPDGVHTLLYNGEQTSFEKDAEDGGSIINPTNATYILWGDIYTDKEINEAFYNMQIKQLELDGETYQGILEKLNGVYIRRSNGATQKVWEWGLDEEMPENYHISSMGENFQLKLYKIYRVDDFSLLLRKHFNSNKQIRLSIK